MGDQKKIHQIEYLQEEQLMIALTGKQRQMRLIPVKVRKIKSVEPRLT